MCKAVLESIDRTHPYESSFLFCSPHKGVKKPVKRYSFPTQCLFISITVIAKDSCNETHSLNHSKPRANKSPDSYWPAIILERPRQTISLTNYRTIFGHMQDPRVLFISSSSDPVQGFEVQGKDMLRGSQDSLLRTTPRHSAQDKGEQPAPRFLTWCMCTSLKGFLHKKKKVVPLVSSPPQGLFPKSLSRK